MEDPDPTLFIRIPLPFTSCPHILDSASPLAVGDIPDPSCYCACWLSLDTHKHLRYAYSHLLGLVCNPFCPVCGSVRFFVASFIGPHSGLGPDLT